MRTRHSTRHAAARRRGIPSAVAVLVFVAAALPSAGRPARAQGFSSGSTGADGALNLTTPGTVVFDPRAFNPPLDQDGDNVYHFTTINIAAGVNVLLAGSKLKMSPVVWLASGAVQIDGTVNLSGEGGYPPRNVIPANRRPSMPGPGGYPGGVGETTDSPAQPGSGPGGGGLVDGERNHNGGGAGHSSRGEGASHGGASYGNVYLVPLVGGSGGGGGTTQVSIAGAGGGAGGGALLVVSSGNIRVNGAFRADGGSGGAESFDSLIGNGGGGSGGAIHLMAVSISGTGALSAIGGSRGHAAVLDGSDGRIRLEAFQQGFTGSIDPAPKYGSPFNVFLPAALPAVRVVSIDGVPVASSPTGSFQVPDVTINTGSASSVLVEARNVPPGTIVKLHLTPESAADQVVDSPPLQGTAELSTTTISVVIPTGLSRGFVRAVWR